ncbi:MAG: hypothetical protein EOP06_15115 [Proteobacteria bacterium]|nr:MAG: hypothetical protein EOP06_15115 [Pseudomonadota bacterium]
MRSLSIESFFTATDDPACRKSEEQTKSGIRTLRKFSKEYVENVADDLNMDVRYTPRSSVLAASAIEKLKQDTSFESDTAIYFFALAGPYPHAGFDNAQAITDNGFQPMETFAKSASPKSFLTYNASSTTARLSIQHRTHGLWSTFSTPLFGLNQAIVQARIDLESRSIKAAIVCGCFNLDELFEIELYARTVPALTECAYAQYTRDASTLITYDAVTGLHGPLSGPIERLTNGKRR